MDKDEIKNNPGNDAPATPAKPAGDVEESEYSETGEEDLIDNIPDSHPGPSPTKKENT